MAEETGRKATSDTDLLVHVADIVSAYVRRNPVGVSALPDLIHTVHRSLNGLNAEVAAPLREKQKPAVPVSKSVQPDYIVCLEDGAHLKMLKRYLRSRFGLSPEDYRRKWGLPPEYPMVAPAYAQRRSDFAKQIGLGKGVRGLA
jgi:predicted transcriptional regulator